MLHSQPPDDLLMLTAVGCGLEGMGTDLRAVAVTASIKVCLVERSKASAVHASTLEWRIELVVEECRWMAARCQRHTTAVISVHRLSLT